MINNDGEAEDMQYGVQVGSAYHVYGFGDEGLSG